MLRGLAAGFVLISVCVLIHTFGLAFLADWLIRHPSTLGRRFNISRHALLLTKSFAIITLLHLIETLVWAGFYDLWGLFADLETSFYFSMGSYTTIGYGDVVLPANWRMLGGVEGINGVLLCGLSTAFLFAIVNRMYSNRAASLFENSSEDDTNEAP